MSRIMQKKPGKDFDAFFKSWPMTYLHFGVRPTCYREDAIVHRYWSVFDILQYLIYSGLTSCSISTVSSERYFKGRNFRGQKLSRVSKIAKFRDFKFREFHVMKKIHGKNFRDFREWLE